MKKRRAARRPPEMDRGSRLLGLPMMSCTDFLTYAPSEPRGGAPRAGVLGVDAGLPRNYVRTCLALLVAEGPVHGYQLLVRLEPLGIRSVDAGFVYRTLRTMEANRHLVSSWEASSSGPARRTYRLTPAGAEWLHQSAAALSATRDCLSGYLHRHRRVQERDHPCLTA